MGKFIFFLFLALVVYLVIKVVVRERPTTTAEDKPAEPMVACARCGVHLPRSEALEASGRLFCCDEHRRLGAP